MTVAQRISVRDLVSHVLARGDLEHGFTGSGRLVQAIYAHQKIQRQRPYEYQPEVAVAHTVQSPNIELTIGGRIDGIWPTDEGFLVEEIKTTTQPLDRATHKKNPLHWGQLKCYAYMYALANDLKTIRGQLTYYHLKTGQTIEFVQAFELETLVQFFNDLVSSYLSWSETIAVWQTHRNESIKKTAFPYASYRPGQRSMAVAVYRAVRNQTPLMIQAATGIGKTMGVLFPAIKALAEGLTEKIFYLTARTTGRLIAEEALNILRKTELSIKSVVITAKDKVCFEPESACNPDECAFAKGYYDRCQAALETAFEQDALSRTVIVNIARQHTICPFAFSLMLAKWVDLIIGDYNYAFDPRVSLKRLFEEQKRSPLLLVDEAHNLVDRSRKMFSASLAKKPFLTVRRPIKNDLPELHRLMGRINRWFLKVRKQGPDDKTTPRIETSSPQVLTPLLWAFIRQADHWLAKNKKTAYREPLLELYFSVTNFLRTLESYDDHYVTCYDPADGDFQVTLFCIDPSDQLGAILKKFRTAVFFSATLTPMTYFVRILGCHEHTPRLIIPSPFPPKNRCIVICTHISTRYFTRKKTRPAVLAALQAPLDAKPGNYFFYFPSHQYMQDVYADFEKTVSAPGVYVQSPHMSEAEREVFIAHFSEKEAGSKVAFAVMGGIFGEGIDLAGDRLSGVAIVGVGLPAFSWQNELIRDYFQTKTEQGFEYAYIYPGINRVLQAAGRVIRSETDTGAILLIDDRFNMARYRKLLPQEWHLAKARNHNDLRQVLTGFWHSADKSGYNNRSKSKWPLTKRRAADMDNSENSEY